VITARERGTAECFGVRGEGEGGWELEGAGGEGRQGDEGKERGDAKG
jgi:hypothetical protein